MPQNKKRYTGGMATNQHTPDLSQTPHLTPIPPSILLLRVVTCLSIGKTNRFSQMDRATSM
jgi:hypothetical protein